MSYRITAAALIIAAGASIASAGLDLLLSFLNRQGPAIVGQLVSTTLYVILGIWLLQASSAFRKVATTDVADQAHLLEGFTKLRNYFMMTGIVAIVLVGVVVLVFLGALMCRMSMRM